MENNKYCNVCVTGGAGYIGSYLIKKLLQKGTYIVHATLRNLGDEKKVGLLKSLEGAKERLKLFEADIYNPEQFEAALNDCKFVFHIATPMLHTHNTQFKDTTEAAVAGVKSIAMSCIRSGTVKRLIYTASVVAASPFNNSGTTGYADFIDESCWTPLDIPLSFAQEHERNYLMSKTESEREILRFGEGGNLEVVSLVCGLVGGEALLPYIPGSVAVFVSPLKDEEIAYRQLKFLEELCGKIPVVHIEDTCDAHIFCIEKDSINGRFLCASEFVSSAEIAKYYQLTYPEHPVKQECSDVQTNVKWGTTKLVDEGFEYKFDLKMILDDSVKCARRVDAI